MSFIADPTALIYAISAQLRSVPDAQDFAAALGKAIATGLKNAVTTGLVGTGTVTSVATSDGLSGGTITGSGTLSVDTTVARRNASNDFATGFQQTFYLDGVGGYGAPQAPRVRTGPGGVFFAGAYDGLILENEYPAVLGGQRWTPANSWIGHGWRTDSGGASEEVKWSSGAVAFQGTAHPTTAWILASSVNGSDGVPRLTVTGGVGGEGGPGTVTAGAFVGDGSGLTGIADAHLSANVALWTPTMTAWRIPVMGGAGKLVDDATFAWDNTKKELLLSGPAASGPHYSQLALVPTGGNDAAMYLRTDRSSGREWFFGTGTGGVGDYGQFRIFDLTRNGPAVTWNHAGWMGLNKSDMAAPLHIYHSAPGTAPYSQIYVQPTGANSDAAICLETTQGSGRQWFIAAGTPALSNTTGLRIVDLALGQRFGIDNNGCVYAVATSQGFGLVPAGGSNPTPVLCRDAGTDDVAVRATGVGGSVTAADSAGTPTNFYCGVLWALAGADLGNNDIGNVNLINVLAVSVGDGTHASVLQCNGTLGANFDLYVPASTGTIATQEYAAAANLLIPVVVSGTTQTIAPGYSYRVHNSGLTTFTLPATFPVDREFEIVGEGAGGWTIVQLAGQTLHGGGGSTTTGVGHGVSSGNQWCSIRCRCVTANTDWNGWDNGGTVAY